MLSVDGTPSFNMQCRQCGGITVYADDSTYTVTGSDQDSLSDKLSEKYAIMADYLTANRLKVNSDKTHLVVMCTDQRRRHNPIRVNIVTENEVIEAMETTTARGSYPPGNYMD